MKNLSTLLTAFIIAGAALFSGCKSCGDCASSCSETKKVAKCSDCAGACKEAKCSDCKCK